MFSRITEKLKGWKTIIWSRTLMTIGLIAGAAYPLLQAINGDQIGVFIPPKYTPFIPLIMAGIGIINEWLRRVTTGPVGSKGDATPPADVKAGD